MQSSSAHPPSCNRRSYAKTAHGQLHLRAAGSPHQPSVVLLHQTPSTGVMYEPLLARLAPAFRVFAPDTPGFGCSDPLPHQPTVESLAAALLEGLSDAGALPALVFGHHTGASLAVAMAHQAPDRVRQLVLSGPPCLDLPERERYASLTSDALSPQRSGSHFERAWEQTLAKSCAAPLELISREAALRLSAGPALATTYAAVWSYDLAARLAQRAHEPLAEMSGRACDEDLHVFPAASLWVAEVSGAAGLLA